MELFPVLSLNILYSSARVREMWRHRAQQRSTPLKREAAVAGLASEGLALVADSAGAGSSAVVVPTPTGPAEFSKSTRDLKALSAAKEHTTEERGGGRDPGARRPGEGRGWLPARFDLRVEFLLKTDSFSSNQSGFVRSHTFYFEGTELYIGPDPYRKGSMTEN